MNQFFVILLLTLASRQAFAKEVSCESVEVYKYDQGPVGSVITCFMNRATAINSTGVTILWPRDETIEGLQLQMNFRIQFLPERVGEKFPNLLIYHAFVALITEVSKVNFQGLSKLQVLLLSSNKIERIASNTFEDLTSLEVLYFGMEFICFWTFRLALKILNSFLSFLVIFIFSIR